VSLAQVREALNDTLKKEVRRRILEDGVRPDGRKLPLPSARWPPKWTWCRACTGRVCSARADAGAQACARSARRATASRSTGCTPKTPSGTCTTTTSALQHGRDVDCCAAPSAANRAWRAGRDGSALGHPAGGQVPLHDPCGERSDVVQRQHEHGERLRQHAGADGNGVPISRPVAGYCDGPDQRGRALRRPDRHPGHRRSPGRHGLQSGGDG